MAQLKDLLVSGQSRFIGDIFGNTLQITKILAPTTSGGTTYGAGSSGNVLRSNSTSIYWGAPVTTNEVYANWSSTSAPDTDKQMNLTVNGSTAGTLKFVAGTGMVLTAAVGNPNTLTIGLGTTAWQAWVAGTTAGPQAKIKIGGTDYTSAAIPSASKTASGIVTTGTQEFKGRKIFGYLTRRGYDDSGNAVRYIEDTYLQNNAGTAVAEHWYDIGDATNITTGKYYWRQYSPNTTASTTTTGFHETYSLPTVTSGLTANQSYSILTTKSAVTIAQGGTGATTAAGARTNLGLGSLATKNGLAWDEITQSGANNLPEGSSDLTDNSEILTSYASNNGFADSNAVGKVYRRDAIAMYNYIKNKASGTWAISISGSAAKLGTSTVGSARQPIYLNAGTATAANYTVNHLGNAGKSNMNDVGRLHASVGMTNLTDPSNTTDNPMNGTTKSTSWHLYWDASYVDDPNASNAWVAQIVNKAGTAQWWVRSRSGGTITNGTAWAADWKHLVVSPQAGQGSATVPIYIDENGHTQSITSYSGNAATATKLGTATVGANNHPIYLYAGVPTECTVGDSFVSYGGQNFSGSYGVIDGIFNNKLRANRLAGVPAAGITIQYSADGGSTWTDYGATNAQKRALFTTVTSLRLVPSGNVTANHQLRIIMDTGASSVYTVLQKLMIYVSTNYSNTCTVTIDAALQNAPTNYTKTICTDQPIAGWSGWNVINISGGLTTYGNTASSQYGRIRFTFKHASITSGREANGLVVQSIYGCGGMGWTTPSTLAATDHVYSFDQDLNVSFPAQVTATQFNGNATTATTATSANQVLIWAGNETAIGATATPANATNTAVWINYRSGYNGATNDGAAQITDYYFGNRKGATTGVNVRAATFVGALSGNATSADSAKWLMNRGTNVTIGDSAWAHGQKGRGGTNTANGTVWKQKWTQSGLTYTPSGGSATSLTDSGDIVYWLSQDTTSNNLWVNMAIDGYIYSHSGFKILTQSAAYNEGIRFVNSSATDKASINSDINGVLGLYASSKVVLRPALNQSTDGVEVATASIIPTKNNSMAIGGVANKWTQLWLQETSSANAAGIQWSNATSGNPTARIGANTSGDLGIYGTTTIYMRPSMSSTDVGAILNATSLYPAKTNTISLGTSTYRWSKLYIGTADSYGSVSLPIYWNAGVPAAITSLSMPANAAITLNGGDLVIGTSGSSSNDSGDIIWKYGNGQEKMRFWSENDYTAKKAPLFRQYTSSGTQLYNGNLVLGDGTGASGSWGISVTGSAGSVAWANVTGKPDSFYTLPTATNTTLGGVKPWYSHTAASTGPTTGSNATAVAVNAISTTSGKYYAIESDSNGRLFVNVPWTDNNTTYPIAGKIIDGNYATKYRTQTKGDTNSGWYISAIRNNTASVSMSPQYGAGLAWGNSDTHGYLYAQYSATSPRVYIGAGNADALLWRKELAMADGTDLSIAYGSSATAAGTAAKTVAITDFVLKTNSVVGVTFDTTSTANNPTLNINGTGAKAMYYRGTRIVYGGLATGFIYIFRYDGTNYQLLNEITPTIGASSTAAGTAAKTVTCPGFILYTGAIAFVKFNNSNTHATPTLNINSTGAKNIVYLDATTTHESKFIKGTTYIFRYNGSQYELIGDYLHHPWTRGVTAVAATYYTQQDYDNYVAANGTAPSWAVGDQKTAAVAEVVGRESLYLGNKTTSNTNNGMNGRLGLYGYNQGVHYIETKLTGNTNRTMYIPNYSGDGYFVHSASDSAVGSTTQPVYVAANGRITAITGAIANSTTGNAATASKLTDITTADAASSSTTWRRVWFAYSDNKTGRPAYDDNFAYQTSTGTLKVGKIQFGSTATYGSTTKPIYWNAGVPGECSTYAGGTAVTLNNSSKAASTASFYAPTSGGTQNTQALVGDGATAAPKWVNISPSITITAGTGSATPKVNVTVLGQSGTAQSLTTASTSVYGCTMLSSATNSTSTTLAATPSAVKAAYDLANTASGYRYWANIESTSAAAYNKAPEMATIKLNGNTSASAASTSNVTLQYNSSIETLNFVFA